jgi:hypothetical protein
MRKRRFHDRVWIERVVLTAVNSTQISAVPLAGLSRAAVERWQAQNDIPEGSRVVAKILEVSKKCELLVDCSRDVFEEAERDLTRPLKIQIQSLENELASY